MSGFESNPFRGHPPDDVEQLPGGLPRFFEEQHLALRGFASKSLYGALTLPYELLSQIVATEIYPKGVTAQFLSSDGLCVARFMALHQSLRQRAIAQYVYSRDGETAIPSGESWQFAGVLLPTSSGADSPYGWVIQSGPLPISPGVPAGSSIEWTGAKWEVAIRFRHAYSMGTKLVLRWPWLMVGFDDSDIQSILERVDAIEHLWNEAQLEEFKDTTRSVLDNIQGVLASAEFTRAISEYQALNEYVASVQQSMENALAVASQQNAEGTALLEAVGSIRSDLDTQITNVLSQITSATEIAAAAAYSEEQSRLNMIAASNARYEAEVQKDLAEGARTRAEAAAGVLAGFLTDSINANPNFGWPSGSAPTSWTIHEQDGGSEINSETNEFGRQVVEFVVASESEEVGLSQTSGLTSFQPGWYVLEAKVKLIEGTLRGAGIRLDTFDTTPDPLETFGIEFSNDNSWLGTPGGGEPGRRYYFNKLIEVTDEDTDSAIFYAYGNDGEEDDSEKKIHFEQASIRYATQAEIDSGEAAGPLEAQVTQSSEAVANMEESAAFYEVMASAGGGFPAIVRLKAGKDGSAVDIAGSKISVYTESGGGAISELARFEDGVATIYGTLRANAIETPMMVANAVTNSMSAKEGYLEGDTHPPAFPTTTSGTFVGLDFDFAYDDLDSEFDVNWRIMGWITHPGQVWGNLTIEGQTLISPETPDGSDYFTTSEFVNTALVNETLYGYGRGRSFSLKGFNTVGLRSGFPNPRQVTVELDWSGGLLRKSLQFYAFVTERKR